MKKNIFGSYEDAISKRFHSFIVDYRVSGNNLEIISNKGESSFVKKTKVNERKINKVIVDNKITMQRMIDDYDDSKSIRCLFLFANIFIVIASGGSCILSFFLGNYLLFLLTVVLFGVCVVLSTLSGFDAYVKVKEIRNLKRTSGYKNDTEFYNYMPKLKSR